MARWMGWGSVALLACTIGCGGGGSTGSSHPLQGTWTGAIVGGAPTILSLSIAGDGTITQILMDDAPSTTLLGGYADDGPDPFTLTLEHDALGMQPEPFLVDAGLQHGALVLTLGGVVAYVVALERDAGPQPIFFNDDIVGSFQGQGIAYEPTALDFQTFGPVTATGTDGTPDNTFLVSFSGSTFSGTFDQFAFGLWMGTADVTGATVYAVMTRDKQFVAVQAIPVGASGLDDMSFFGLSRQ